jgi:hypothetical protein
VAAGNFQRAHSPSRPAIALDLDEMVALKTEGLRASRAADLASERRRLVDLAAEEAEEQRRAAERKAAAQARTRADLAAQIDSRKSVRKSMEAKEVRYIVILHLTSLAIWLKKEKGEKRERKKEGEEGMVSPRKRA